MSCRFGLAILALVCVSPGFASGLSAQDKFANPFGLSFGTQDDSDIDVTAVLVPVDARTVELQVTVTLPAGYYIYSMNPAFSGFSSISLKNLGSLKPLETTWRPDREPKVAYEALFAQNVEKFYDQVIWSQKLQASGDRLPADLSVTGELTGQFCSSGDASGSGGVCKPLIPPRQFTAVLDANAAVASETTAKAKSRHPDQSPVQLNPEVGFGDNKKPAPIRYVISLTPEQPRVGDEVNLQIQADIDRPWHTFALDQDPAMAGLPTEISITEMSGLEAIDKEFTASVEPEIEQPLEDYVQRVHYDTVTWTRRLKATGEWVRVHGTVGYQLCNEGSCTNPAEISFTVVTGVEPPSGLRTPSEVTPPQDSASESEIGSATDSAGLTSDGLIAFIIAAAGAGFLALLTPCVFPMVPVTVAFFLKQSEKKSGSPVWLAIVYCLGIVGAFTILGLLVSIIFGPSKLNELANNRWLNLFFAGLFLVFSLMLMGMFELRMPSWLLTWSSKRESSGGYVGALFMALTFTLVSFTCTFAFVGTLLVWAAKGDRFWPILGMLAFSAAFASPFFFLALFPSMLKKLPRSGGWMNTVKVTAGLVELGFVLKFLSVADIGFSPDRLPFLLDTESFLVGWIVLAVVTGFYLLNMFRMTHDMPAEGISALRCLFAILFLSFGAYVGAGLFSEAPPSGWLWQQIQAFAPPGKPTHQLDFRVAVTQASREQKLLFVDFTGVNCINCRRMEKTVLADPSIHETLASLVQVQLFTDEIPGLKNKALRDELLNLNRQLQQDLVKDTTLPVYAVLTPDGKQVIAKFSGLDTTGGEDFLKFLNAGIDLWQKHNEQQSVANQDTSASPAGRIR